MQSFLQHLPNRTTGANDSSTTSSSEPTRGRQSYEPNTSTEDREAGLRPAVPLNPPRVYSQLLDGNEFSPDVLRRYERDQKSPSGLSVVTLSSYSVETPSNPSAVAPSTSSFRTPEYA